MGGIGKAVGKVVGGITGANDQAKAAESAAQTQAATSQAAIDEQKRQFDSIVKLLSPYVNTGTNAVNAQADILGLNGAANSMQAINSLQNSPIFQGIAQQGENAILQNSAATGGLRGGNTQAALAQYRPALLQQYLQQHFQNLGSLSGLGQASAAGQASAGQASAANIGNLLGQKGAALTGGQIASGNQQANAFNSLVGLGGLIAAF